MTDNTVARKKPGTKPKPPAEAFELRTEPLPWSGCLAWKGGVSMKGYGHFYPGGKFFLAHRWAYEQANGPIPQGMQVDHICRVRICVNADHLRLATHGENQRNRSGRVRNRKHDLPRGVQPNGKNGYSAVVTHDRNVMYLGTYRTPEEASVVARAKRAELFGAYKGRG